MYNKLLKLSENSSSIYSNFRVSAILKLDDGSEVNGVNVESSSFGATMCAERNAINFAITSGIKMDKIKEIHILGYSSIKKKGQNNFFIMPCGICRQVMSEYLDKNTKVIVYNFATKSHKEYLNRDLLPGFFSGKEL